jgi:hypothetical protein
MSGTKVTQVTSSQLTEYRALSSAVMKRQVGARLKAAGEVIAVAARTISGSFSKRIPGTVKIIGGTTEVYVQAGGDEAPNAKPFEDGSYHPVFATGPRSGWTWRKQPKKPFLEEAAAAAGDAAAEAFSAVLDDWIADIQ